MFRSRVLQEEADKALETLQHIHTMAKEAVALGDGTLKEATNTYNTLAGMFWLMFLPIDYYYSGKYWCDWSSWAGFQSQVEKSSESAKLALQTVPDIESQITEAEKTVEEAENVWTQCNSIVNDSPEW